MVGDMFTNGFKATVSGLCSELSISRRHPEGQLNSLGDLDHNSILSDDEFTSKKAESLCSKLSL